MIEILKLLTEWKAGKPFRRVRLELNEYNCIEILLSETDGYAKRQNVAMVSMREMATSIDIVGLITVKLKCLMAEFDA